MGNSVPVDPEAETVPDEREKLLRALTAANERWQQAAKAAKARQEVIERQDTIIAAHEATIARAAAAIPEPYRTCCGGGRCARPEVDQDDCCAIHLCWLALNGTGSESSVSGDGNK